jgi:hypothetical protein
MTNASDDAEERERAELKVMLRQALEERARLEAEHKALRKEKARLLKSLLGRPKRNSSAAS